MEKYFFEAFSDMLRLGPGSKEATLEAIAMIPVDNEVKILDIGCGVGTHTFIVAEALPNAIITAIDNNADYINQLNQTATKLGLANRVEGVTMSMFDMNFESASYNFIFSEGAIYIAGFEQGLREWKKILKPGGAIICSEISWITETPSPEPKEYWVAAYPQIDTISNKVALAETLGYTSLKTSILPPNCWTDNYYQPLQNNLNTMKNRYIDNFEAQQVIEIIEQEIDMYNRYGNEYSYVFYTLQTV